MPPVQPPYPDESKGKRVPADPDVLIQVHIPKCAGTAVGVWLRRAALDGMAGGFAALYPGPAHIYGKDELLPGFDDPRVRVASSHNVRRFGPRNGKRRVRYFTLLRDPVAQFLSGARVTLEQRELFGVPAAVGGTVRDVAAWMLQRPLDAPFRENAQTNHLAMYIWCDATNGRCLPDAREGWSATDRAAYERERLGIAKDVLQSFLAVGTVERIAESLEILRERCAAFGLHLLPVDRLEQVNVTNQPAGDVAWIESDPVGARLQESVAVDRELYAFAGELLDEGGSRKRRPNAR